MQRIEIEQLLPGVFQRTIRPGNPIYGFLEAMDALHAPSEAKLKNLDAIFDPRRTPDAFVPLLARWVDLDRLFGAGPQISTGSARLRELIAVAGYLSQWRGTAKGFLLFLETATGVSGFKLEENPVGADGMPRPFHICIRAPAETAAHQALIQRIIELEKPAYVSYEIEFGGTK